MNYPVISKVLGRVMGLEAVLMIPSMITALCYGESLLWYVETAAVAAVLAVLLNLPKVKDKDFYAREGFTSVALAWVLMSAVGALPFVFSGEIPSYIDAFFEIVSGFTTTGATILTDVEAMSKGLLLWRSLSHWIGGMGVLVFIMAVLPMSEERSMYIMRAEVPGTTFGKLVPRIRTSSAITYLIYIVLTVILIVLLCAGGMPFFDSINHAMATAGTGGFSVKQLSVGYYDSVYIDIVTSIFMLLFGVNFSVYFLLLVRKFKAALTDSEFLGYFGIALGAAVLIALDIIDEYGGFWNAFRYSLFQVSSLMTTTGFATADFTLWPAFSKSILIIVMLIGASAGSTGGGLKVSRVIIFFKCAAAELGRMLNPRRTVSIRVNGKAIATSTVHNTLVFISLYFLLTFVITALVSLDGYDFETTFASVVSCMSNVGPGLGPAGPMGSFDIYSDLSKVLLSFAMLAGRLEIFPMLLLFSPDTWRRH
ncbi:MAG TPA: TrkH family potassium uptake protein [Candidatus Scatomorpha gallistercoris]|nr:TrkH family potassium uptake protein [Candidatus Scatomorpha gallistercoris]